jgi:very-short-patch-repair endonuclease
MSNLTNLARANRKNPTPAESKLYYALRELKIGHWSRQFPIGNKYIADIICRSKRLIIECDGGQHYTKDGLESDNVRTEFLRQQGYTVLHFGNDEILKKYKWCFVYYLPRNGNKLPILTNNPQKKSMVR